jgi:peptide/nickel transport system permease protein
VAGGTVIFETIFGLPGMGRFFLDAINQRDYPVVQGVILMAASIIVFVNLLVDMTYAYLDPRIRYQ